VPTPQHRNRRQRGVGGRQTGGLAYFPIGADDLPRIYREIADELTSQYLVAYAPANVARDGGGGVSRFA